MAKGSRGGKIGAGGTSNNKADNVQLRAENGTYYKIIQNVGSRKPEVLEATAPLYDYGGEIFAIERRERGSYNITHTGTGRTLGNATSVEAAKKRIKELTNRPEIKRQMQEGAGRFSKMVSEYLHPTKK